MSQRSQPTRPRESPARADQERTKRQIGLRFLQVGSLKANRLRSREPGMLTTDADHNDIRLRSMRSDSGKPVSQVNDSSRQGAGSLQARDQTQRGPRTGQMLRWRGVLSCLAAVAGVSGYALTHVE